MRIKPLALLLDDDEFFRKMMEKVLVRLGFTIKTVATVEEFRQSKSDLSPDLYLLDLNLGQQSGLTLIEELRQSDPATPIVVVSGTDDRAVVSHALEIGANDFLVKPFNRTLIAMKLGQFVRTEEIEEQKRFVETEDSADTTAKAFLDAEIISLDEIGVAILSTHLILKGTVLRLGGELMNQLGAQNGCLVCVTSTSLMSGSAAYEIQMEFEEPGVEFLQAVRQYVKSSASGKAA